MKIAFFGAEGVPYPNAFATITEEVGRRLIQQGHEVVVYCRKHFVSQSGDHLGMRRVVLPSINTKHLDTLSFCAIASAHAIGIERPDVLHVFGQGPALFSPVLKAGGLRTVAQIQGLDWKRAKWGGTASRILRFGEWCSAHHSDALTVVSTALYDHYLQRYGREAVVIPNGVDACDLVPAKLLESMDIVPGCYILFFARLVPEKGAHHLIEAFKSLDTDLKLVIAGSPAHTSDYADRLRRSAAGDARILFVGHATGQFKAELLSHAAVAVQPSDLEGLSLGLLEMMAYGRPIVASDIPENREALGECGLYFSPGNADQLRDRLDWVMRHRAVVTRVGEAAADRARERFSWDAIARNLAHLYRAVAARSQACRGSRRVDSTPAMMPLGGPGGWSHRSDYQPTDGGEYGETASPAGRPVGHRDHGDAADAIAGMTSKGGPT